MTFQAVDEEGKESKAKVKVLMNEKAIEKAQALAGYNLFVTSEIHMAGSEVYHTYHNLWRIEESFRIMKSEFKARPVYLQRDDRIEAHFTTCFISLMIYRILEKKLGEKYTCHDIVTGLRDMNFFEITGEGYLPTYTRTDLTDDLHDAFGFRTDYQIVNTKQMKKIFKDTKK